MVIGHCITGVGPKTSPARPTQQPQASKSTVALFTAVAASDGIKVPWLVKNSPFASWHQDEMAEKSSRGSQLVDEDSEDSSSASDEKQENIVGWVSSFFELFHSSLPTIPVRVDGHPLRALLKSGSELNFIRKDAIPGMQGLACDCSFLIIGGFVTLDTILPATIQAGGRKTKANFFVFDGLAYDVVIGNPTMIKMGFRWRQKDPILTLKDVKRQYPSLFQDKEPVKAVAFELYPGHRIVRQPARRLYGEKLQWAQEKIEELLQRNIIRPSHSPYASPCVIANKGDFDFRLVQDYTQLNEVTKVNNFPIPHVYDLLFSFSGCEFFSKMDLTEASYQIKLTEETKRFTAFVLPFGKFEMNRLPVGWKNTSAIIQQTMQDILGDLPTNNSKRVKWYMDDILIGGETSEDCLEMTHLVLQRLQQYNMRINESKCCFMEPWVEFLGKVIDGYTISPKLDSINKVEFAQKPHDFDTLVKFLDQVGNFKLFIVDFAEKTRPLKECKRELQFNWTKSCDDAFNQLVEIISSNPRLDLPDFCLPFHLTCFFSKFGCWSFMWQAAPPSRTVAHQSYSFSQGEANYSIEDKERLAVVKALEYFYWLWRPSYSIIIHTDFQALTSLMSMQKPASHQFHWQKVISAIQPVFKERTFQPEYKVFQEPVIGYSTLYELGLEMKQDCRESINPSHLGK